MAINPNDIVWDDDQQPSTTAVPAPAPTAPTAAPTGPAETDIQWDDADEPQEEEIVVRAPPRPKMSASTTPAKPVPPKTRPTAAPKQPVEMVDTSVKVGGFSDELPEEPASKMSPEDEAHIVELVKNGASAAEIRAYSTSKGFNITNAEEIVAYRDKHGKASSTFAYHLPEVDRNADEEFGAGARGVGKGVTFRFLDEAGAVVDAVGLTEGRQNIWNSDLSFGDLYNRNVDQNRAILGADERNHPVYSYGGEIAGSLITLKPTGMAATALNAGRVGRTGQIALEGAATGALYGAGGADNGDRVLGAIGGATLGAATSVAGDKIIGGMARQSARDAQAGREVLDAADGLNARHGTNIQPVAGNVGGKGSQVLTGGSEQTILGGIQLGRAADKLATESGEVAASMGGSKTLTETGEALTQKGNPNSLINLPTRLKQRYDAFYERAGNAAGNIKLGTPKAIAALDQEIARLEEVPGGVAGLAKLKELRKALEGGATVNGLRRLRTTFGDSLETGDRTVRDVSKKLWGPLSDDIAEGLSAAGKADAANLYRRADTAFREAQKHIGAVNSLLEGKSGQQVATSLSALSKNDDKLLQNILRIASPEEAKAIQGGIIQSLGRAKDSAQNAAGSAFSLESFLTNYSKLSDAAKARIFNGQLRTDLADLAKIAESARRGRGFRNISKTGGAINFQNVMRVVDGFHAAATGGKTALLSGSVGFLLSSPRVARALVRWGESGGTRAELAETLSRVAGRMTGMNGADVVNSFISFLKEDEPVAGPTKAPAEDFREDQFDGIDAYAFDPDAQQEEDEVLADDALADDEPIVFYDEDGNPL